MKHVILFKTILILIVLTAISFANDFSQEGVFFSSDVLVFEFPKYKDRLQIQYFWKPHFGKAANFKVALYYVELCNAQNPRTQQELINLYSSVDPETNIHDRESKLCRFASNCPTYIFEIPSDVRFKIINRDTNEVISDSGMKTVNTVIQVVALSHDPKFGVEFFTEPSNSLDNLMDYYQTPVPEEALRGWGAGSARDKGVVIDVTLSTQHEFELDESFSGLVKATLRGYAEKITRENGKFIFNDFKPIDGSPAGLSKFQLKLTNSVGRVLENNPYLRAALSDKNNCAGLLDVE